MRRSRSRELRPVFGIQNIRFIMFRFFACFTWYCRNKVLVANHIRRMGAAFGALRAIFRALFGCNDAVEFCMHGSSRDHGEPTSLPVAGPGSVYAGDYASLRARKWAKKWP